MHMFIQWKNGYSVFYTVNYARCYSHRLSETETISDNTSSHGPIKPTLIAWQTFYRITLAHYTGVEKLLEYLQKASMTPF